MAAFVFGPGLGYRACEAIHELLDPELSSNDGYRRLTGNPFQQVPNIVIYRVDHAIAVSQVIVLSSRVLGDISLALLLVFHAEFAIYRP